MHYLLDKRVKDHAHEELIDLLKMIYKRGVRFGRIILVGDILENWFFSATRKLKKKRKMFNRLFDRIDRLAPAGSEKIYILGNHDAVRFDMRLPIHIEGYLTARDWQIKEVYETTEMVVAHGHQGQYGKLFWFFNIVFLRILYRFASLFPSLYRFCDSFYRKHFNFDRHNTQEQMLDYYARLSHILKQEDRLMVSGHTHQFLHLDDLKVINTGDWIDSKTFVIQDGLVFHGLRYAGKKTLVEEFEYKHK